MSILIFVLKALLIIYGISAAFGIICFVKDTTKWHNAEKKVEIIPSAERSEENGRNGSTGDRGNNDNRTGDGDNNNSTGDGDNNNSTGDGDRDNNSNKYDW